MAGIYDEQIIGAKQQAETARKLREGVKAPEGQMVSGWYVAPSITQYLAQALKSYDAGQQEKTAQADYEKATRQKSDETARLLKQLEPQARTDVSPDLANAAYGQGDINSVLASPLPQTSTEYVQPSEQQRMSALLRGAAVNPEAFAPQIKMAEWDMNRQDRQAQLQQAAELKREQMAAQQEQWRRDEALRRDMASMSRGGGAENQRGQIIFDNKGNAFNVNPYTNEVRPVSMGGQQIQGAQYSPELQGGIAGAKALAGQTGKATGEAAANLMDMESQLPHLEKLVNELNALGKKATYTKVGQAADFARRQTGMGVGEGAVARKEYITRVDNEVLPLLRQTFGAQFTQKEGESLKATLGDPDASPEEKDAVLRSFIQTKAAQVETTKRRLGQSDTQAQDTPPPGAVRRKQ